jgi:hypothetical protein
MENGRRAIEYADRGADAYFAMHARTTLAEVHFMLGADEEAGALFQQARQIDEERRPRPAFLYSQSLYRYGYYLIETGQADRVIDEAASDPAWGSNGTDSSLLSKAIRCLVLGAARRSIMERGDASPTMRAEGRRELDEAVALLRTAGYADYVVRGLLERAHYWRTRGQTGDYARALADLQKAESEALRGDMTLLYADVLLERLANHFVVWPTMSNPERAAIGESIRALLAELSDLVESIGYGRRRSALAEIRRDAERYHVVVGDVDV